MNSLEALAERLGDLEVLLGDYIERLGDLEYGFDRMRMASRNSKETQ